MRITENMVLFWGSKDLYSNWHPSPFVLKGQRYAHVEQYMMAAKARLFGDTATEAKILATTDPKHIKALGREVRGYVDAVWREHRLTVVIEACVAKFSQNEKLGAMLLATGQRTLVEASPVDRVWGIGLAENDPCALDPATWRGENLLGIALMHARDHLAKQATQGTTAELF